MKGKVKTPPNKIQAWIDAAARRMKVLHEQGRYQEALNISLQMARAYPNLAGAWGNVAAHYAGLGRWQEAIDYAQTALARGGNTFELYDTLSSAYGQLGQWEQARRYGLQALNMRARHFSHAPVIPWPESGPMPPPPGAQTRERNIIAFSLFGRDSKYCEPAVLNVQEQPRIYPHWVCRFYVDDSVPENVIHRLRAGGAQIVPVIGPALQWPGAMWRFLALNDPLAHRILFRDTDSVIARREAAAVRQWAASGKRFHMMRDSGAHTELMLAGQWGAVAGSLPPLDKLMERFVSAPLESRRFADQFFLRQYIWPYAWNSLMQHDAIFGFMNAAPFPTARAAGEHNVGYPEGAAFFAIKSDLPDGAEIAWSLYQLAKRDDEKIREKLICSYTNAVHNGTLKVYIPERYMNWIKQGAACVRTMGGRQSILN
jgi:hypothetical protein